jgi:hypothetical protein
MPNNPPIPSGTAERLDEQTERRIEDYRDWIRKSMHEGRTPFGRLELTREYEENALMALRARIRELIEEARKEGIAFRNTQNRHSEFARDLETFGNSND